MKMLSLSEELKGNSYPGRGIVIGRSEDGTKAVTAYFIMGRSVNSRNRVFVTEGEGIRTEAFDPSKLEDPSLIIYAPVRVLGNRTIVTNGDQTDTIYDGMDKELTFEQSLRCREFEPDGPNYTPRISGVMHIEGGQYDYAMSILKSNNGDPSACNRYTFSYENPANGEGHFIHTYMHDDNPLPSFEGEPKLVGISGDIDTFANMVWESLNEENKVSLFVRADGAVFTDQFIEFFVPAMQRGHGDTEYPECGHVCAGCDFQCTSDPAVRCYGSWYGNGTCLCLHQPDDDSAVLYPQ